MLTNAFRVIINNQFKKSFYGKKKFLIYIFFVFAITKFDLGSVRIIGLKKCVFKNSVLKTQFWKSQ